MYDSKCFFGLDGRNYLREIKERCTLKKLFPAIKHSNLQGKSVC